MVLKIRKPKNFSIGQVLIVSVIGILTGVYIWQPLIVKHKKEINPENHLSAIKKIV